MTRFHRRFFVVGLLLVAVAGCSVSGPAFRPVADAPQSKALVYIYRPGGLIGGAVSYMVRTGDQEIVDLKTGGYYPYLAEPGEREFWARTEARTSVTEQLRAGETYYLKGGIGVGFFVGHPKLSFVSREEGERDISSCRLIER